jgi:trans-2,3-dihydro-3-hydroxyanthranilate isomerase
MQGLSRRSFGRLASAAFVAPFVQSAPSRRYPYVHLDVFTSRPFEGNQLLVFTQPAGLDTASMHAITRESNLSECTFVFPPTAGSDFTVRIFTRNGETPFAGHPTIGTAFALAHGGTLKAGTGRTVFGLGVGPTPIDLEWNGSNLRFAWMTQLRPTFGKSITDSAALAAALGIEGDALAGVPAQEVGCGSTFLIVPVRSRRDVDAAAIDRGRLDAVVTAAGLQRRGVYIVTTEAGGDDAVAYSRLLPAAGGIEDPATGSAAGPAGCFLVRHGLIQADRAAAIVVAQGVLVRRPSRIHVNVSLQGDDITSVKVGGASIVLGEGSVAI